MKQLSGARSLTRQVLIVDGGLAAPRAPQRAASGR